MAYGDVNYEIVKTASVAYATTALSQLLLLTDNSLSSTFNLDEVFVLQVVQTGANAMRIAPSSLSNDISVWPFSAASPLYEFQPTSVRNIVNLVAYNAAASANASANFVFYCREP